MSDVQKVVKYVRWWRDQILKRKPNPVNAYAATTLDKMADSIERGEYEEEKKDDDGGREIAL